MPATPPRPRQRRFFTFVPILAGATLRERAIACLGAGIGIALTALVCGLVFGDARTVVLIVAPMGASAVLVYAVPSSPLAQPWPVLGGNAISAAVGLAVAQVVADPVLAAGLAVALAIAAMSLTRSLHPPGGAAALTAVIGGPSVDAWGILFPLAPVAANAAVLVLAGIAFHRLAGRPYPHVAPAAPVNTHLTADPPAHVRGAPRPEDVDAALAAMDESFDIDRGDIVRLIDAVEKQVLAREHGALRAADIMSRDIVTATPGMTRDAVLSLLLRHNIRGLPVVDAEDRLTGVVGLRELATLGDIADVPTSPAHSALPDTPAVSLVPMLTDGRAHAVVIIDHERRVVGLITQTDLLAALARPFATAPMATAA